MNRYCVQCGYLFVQCLFADYNYASNKSTLNSSDSILINPQMTSRQNYLLFFGLF